MMVKGERAYGARPNLAKVRVVSSNLIARSNSSQHPRRDRFRCTDPVRRGAVPGGGVSEEVGIA